MKAKKLLSALMAAMLAVPSATLNAGAVKTVAGDANGDGKFTIADIVIMHNYLMGSGSTYPTLKCDFVSDGTIDAFDLIEMRKQLLEAPAYVQYTAENLSKNILAEETKGLNADTEFKVAQTKFAVELLQKEVEKAENGNVMISPYSVMQALAMTANGADGNTKTEMENALGGIDIDRLNKYLYTQRVSQPNEEKCYLTTANSLWGRNNCISILPEYIQATKNYYDADLFMGDFNNDTLNDINKWVNVNTEGMIPSIINNIPDDAVMYLINAVAFNADWQKDYKKHNVFDSEFTAYDGTVQSCEMMSSEEFTYICDENAEGFLKYYSGGRYAFAGILPKEGMTTEEYVAGLTGDSFRSMLSNKSSETVITLLPKFECEYDTTLTDPLKDMGMGSAMDPDADFTRMGKTFTNKLFISDVLHKTFISVTETGTKAGAATAVVMATTGPCAPDPEPPKEVLLTRPFVYGIIDTKTNLPIFIGTFNKFDES